MRAYALTIAAVSALPSTAAQTQGLQQVSLNRKDPPPGFEYVGQGYCFDTNGRDYSWGNIRYGPGNEGGVVTFQDAVSSCPDSPGLVGVQDEIDKNNNDVDPGGVCVCLYEGESMNSIDFDVFGDDYMTGYGGVGPVRGTFYAKYAHCYARSQIEPQSFDADPDDAPIDDAPAPATDTAVDATTATDTTDGESDEPSDEQSPSSGFDRARDNVQEAKEEVNQVINTAPSEWTTGQKVGVAVGVVAAVLILLCIIKKCCCL